MNLEETLADLKTPAPEHLADGVLLGTGLADGFDTFDSPLGEVIVAFNIRGISAVDLAEDDALERFASRFHRRLVEANPPHGWRDRIRRALDRGAPGSLPIDFRSVTTFQQQVLIETAHIPKGQVRSYGWLAKIIDHPRATRAVGSTMARNPVPLIIPCHRVVRADGRIGNYALGGPDNKVRLLEAEGADLARLEDLARRDVRFLGSDTTHIYCHPTCRQARRISERHLVEFRSESEAVEAGYRPCQVCRP